MSTQSLLFSRITRLSYTLLGFGAALGALCLLHGAPVQAQAPGVNLTALYNQVQALQATVNAQVATITTQGTTITSLQNTVNAQVAQISALQAQTQYISTGTDENGYPATFITQCNVWVQDGSGSTVPPDGHLTGLGNLIIGYNEADGNTRKGCHNLILGISNSYSSYGGLVAGANNAITGPYSSITGGEYNTAGGLASSVSGGESNMASGKVSSVSGGYVNVASGGASTVSGGTGLTQRTAFGWYAGSYHSP